VPAGSTAVELAPNRFSQPAVSNVFRILGRGDRKSLCDCDRATGPSIRQPIYLMSDPRVIEKISSGRLARLLNDGATDAAIVEEISLATLTRLPDDAERDAVWRHLAESADRRAALADVVWALVNTREFATNH